MQILKMFAVLDVAKHLLNPERNACPKSLLHPSNVIQGGDEWM